MPPLKPWEEFVIGHINYYLLISLLGFVTIIFLHFVWSSYFGISQIYRSCEESYRLSESGNLNVPKDKTEEYCNGPCLTETHLVVNCIDNILRNFLFYNKATIQDVRDTIQAGCGYGPERGNNYLI